MASRRPVTVTAFTPSTVHGRKRCAVVRVTVKRGPDSHVVASTGRRSVLAASARTVVRNEYAPWSGSRVEENTSVFGGTGAGVAALSGRLSRAGRTTRVRGS